MKKRKSALDELEKICAHCVYSKRMEERPNMRLCHYWKSSWGPAVKRDRDTCGMWNFGVGDKPKVKHGPRKYWRG